MLLFSPVLNVLDLQISVLLLKDLATSREAEIEDCGGSGGDGGRAEKCLRRHKGKVRYLRIRETRRGAKSIKAVRTSSALESPKHVSGYGCLKVFGLRRMCNCGASSTVKYGPALYATLMKGQERPSACQSYWLG